MNLSGGDAYIDAISNAHLALQAGSRLEARREAEKALLIDPQREEAWLILASLSTPRASISYLTKALEINPSSQHARMGMHWAAQRLREEQAQSAQAAAHISIEPVTIQSLVRPRQTLTPYLILVVLFGVGLLLWYSMPTLSALRFQYQPVAAIFIPTSTQVAPATREAPTIPAPTATSQPAFPMQPVEQAIVAEPTAVLLVLPTTPAATATETPLPDMPTLLDLPTEVPAPTEVAVEQPKKKKKNKSNQVAKNSPALAVESGQRWIDVDLSDQRTYAYDGDEMLRSFLVSTGTYQFPTVEGRYQVYVKYRNQDMSGPGYYLPGVPYVMYFYKGYGLHGTYWHNNFGTPMSHGCVNLNIDDAAWLYEFASVGTLVNVHQ